MNNDVGVADRPTRVRNTSGENTGLLLIPTYLFVSFIAITLLNYRTHYC